jgi:hypothetical protein
VSVRPAAWTVLIGVVAGPRRVTAAHEGTDQDEERQQSGHAVDDSRTCAAHQRRDVGEHVIRGINFITYPLAITGCRTKPGMGEEIPDAIAIATMSEG